MKCDRTNKMNTISNSREPKPQVINFPERNVDTMIKNKNYVSMPGKVMQRKSRLLLKMEGTSCKSSVH